VLPQNEQKNINLSIKGDWDVGLGTLTAYLAYNNQDNYFLTDGTSAAFGLYALNSVCQQSFAARAGDTPLDAPFNYGTPPPNMANAFLPPYSPTTCDGYQYQQRDQKDTSMEIRLTSPGDQRARWVAGLYFADIQRDVVVSQGADLDKGLDATAFVPTSGPNPTDLLYDDTFDSTVYAVFGQLAFDIVDNLEVALALRYDSEEREVQNNVPTCSATDSKSCRAQTPGFTFNSNPYINPAYTVTPAYATNGIPDRSKTFDQFQPKLSLNWKLTDDFALFASYGYGFRSGGFNSSGSQATVEGAFGGLCLGEGTAPFGLGVPVCGPNSVRNITHVSDTYDEEVSKAAEIGFKSYFLDRRLSVNGAVFQTDVEDMQFFNFFAGPFGLLRVVTNLDEVSLQGAELDFRWQMFDAFSVFGGYSFTDGEIDRYDGRPYTKGNEVPYAPEYTGNAGAELALPVGEKLTFLARLDASFVGETWFHPVQNEKLPNLFTYFNFGQGEFSKMQRDPYTTLNLRLGLQGERWGVTAWGRNVTDEDYLQEIIPAPEFGGSFIHDSPGDSYGVEVNVKF
jgi:iron complex outermembrane receptor protein